LHSRCEDEACLSKVREGKCLGGTSRDNIVITVGVNDRGQTEYIGSIGCDRYRGQWLGEDWRPTVLKSACDDSDDRVYIGRIWDDGNREIVGGKCAAV
jgi:hypothetical protein